MFIISLVNAQLEVTTEQELLVSHSAGEVTAVERVF